MKTVKINLSKGARLSTPAERSALAQKMQSRTNAWARKALGR